MLSQQTESARGFGHVEYTTCGGGYREKKPKKTKRFEISSRIAILGLKKSQHGISK